MICEHCKTRISGAADITGEIALHADCSDEYHAAKQGRPYRCPLCFGSGFEYNRDVHEIETYDPSGGYNGYFSPVGTRVVTRREQKECDFCNGRGFLAKQPKPIVQPAIAEKVIGWTHE
jgi:DnaJ-class molecular chaperone